MCGIVGAVATRDVVPILIEGLKRLEYRGYDSAGVAVLEGEPARQKLRRVRAAGRVASLEKLAGAMKIAGGVGVAHTRWATHGVPSERNAHPHISGGVSVVHNGIIENHEAIRECLKDRGYRFQSETDTEVIAHLVHFFRNTETTLFDAVRCAAAQLKGAYAIAVICERDPGRLVATRHGAPLLLGVGDGEHFAASDSSALIQVTRRIIYLEDGDCAEISGDAVRIVDAEGRVAVRPEQESKLSSAAVELGDYPHYMLKEIFEQPTAVAETLESALAAEQFLPELFGAGAGEVLRKVTSVRLLSCGTSNHAAQVARYWIESLAGVPCDAEIASEYRYRDSVPDPDALVVAISQSGETADTLAALEHARALGHKHCLAICNVPESALVRSCALRFLTRAGPEIGVASTKAFTTQLAALALLAMVLAKLRGRMTPAQEQEHLTGLRNLPAALLQVLRLAPQIQAWANEFTRHEHALFLGRGIHYPVAMEGALKLKEISYIHAEAYAAGELKHGPLALVDENMPVIAIAPKDALFEKLKSNLQEVRARGGRLYVLADHDANLGAAEGGLGAAEGKPGGAAGGAVQVIRLPATAGLLSPVVHSVPLQLLAYYAALARGNDVDKPRNLAKSVTVE